MYGKAKKSRSEKMKGYYDQEGRMKRAGIGIGVAGLLAMIVTAGSAENLSVMEIACGVATGTGMMIAGNALYTIADYLERRWRRCKRAKRLGKVA